MEEERGGRRGGETRTGCGGATENPLAAMERIDRSEVQIGLCVGCRLEVEWISWK